MGIQLSFIITLSIGSFNSFKEISEEKENSSITDLKRV